MSKEILHPVHLRMPVKHIEILQRLARQESLCFSAIVRKALEEWLANRKD